MSSRNFLQENPKTEAEIAAALRSLPQKSARNGGWKRVLDRYEAEQQSGVQRRRYWGGGLAVAASIAVAVVGLRLGAGVFFGAPENVGDIDAELRGTFPESATAGEELIAGDRVALEEQVAQMDMDALIAFSRFQEERLRALPAVSHPGRVLEVDAFGLVTELEDQIALLDEGLIPASLDSDDRSFPRRLLQERAILMDDLFSMRRAEAAQAGFMYADF
jgi:hypothetical protein